MSEEKLEPTHVQLAFSDRQLRDLVVATIASAIGDEKRDNLIKQAIDQLFRPPTGNQYDRRSQIERAFADAVASYAGKAVTQLVEGQYKAQIDEIVGKAMQGVLEKNRDLVSEKLADAVATALAKGMGRDY